MEISLYDYLKENHGPHCASDLHYAYEEGGIEKAIEVAKSWDDNYEDYISLIKADIEAWEKL